MALSLRKKFDIIDLIDGISWEKCQTQTRLSIAQDELTINFRNAAKTKAKEKINQISVRFGGDIIKELEWDDGDRLMCLYDPKDKKNFMIVKCGLATKGVRLSKEPTGHPYRTVFTWSNTERVLPFMAPTAVEWAIHKKGLYFRVEDPKENEL